MSLSTQKLYLMLHCVCLMSVQAKWHMLRRDGHCPAEVAQLINRCLEPDPAKRPSAQDIVRELDRLSSGASRVQELVRSCKLVPAVCQADQSGR